MKVDVAILGAGAAGLAAALEVSRQGRSVCLLEARERLGGRILTREDVALPVPVELGAEFIHGRSATIAHWLQLTRTSAVDAPQTRQLLYRGRLQDADALFEAMKRGLERSRRPAHDLPFADHLAGAARKHLTPRARTFARSLVEGYDAADAARISTHEVLDEWSGAGAADAPTFRPHAGYGALIDALQRLLDRDRVQIRLNTRVQEVHWRPGAVRVLCERLGRPFEVEADQAVVALPLGVLQLPEELPDAVRFVPPLHSKRAAFAGLAVGAVIKVVLQFSSAFWEEIDDSKYRDVAFFTAPDQPFPTFWTTLPARSAALTAWSAGPNALRLSGRSESSLSQHALDSLAAIFPPRRRWERTLERAYVHDWHADRFARGAYSYVTAGASDARHVLARPLERTLFFAGEATDLQGEAATVFGALSSGERAARQLTAKERAPKRGG